VAEVIFCSESAAAASGSGDIIVSGAGIKRFSRGFTQGRFFKEELGVRGRRRFETMN